MKDVGLSGTLVVLGLGIAYLGFSGNLPVFLMAVFYPQYVQAGG